LVPRHGRKITIVGGYGRDWPLRRRSVGSLSPGAGHHSAPAGIDRFAAALWKDAQGTKQGVTGRRLRPWCGPTARHLGPRA